MEYLLGKVSDDYTNRKINWIKDFRGATGSKLVASKAMFELLEARGYDLSTQSSILSAAVAYQHWLRLANDDARLLEKLLAELAHAERTYNAGKLANLLHSMTDDKLAIPFEDKTDVDDVW